MRRRSDPLERPMRRGAGLQQTMAESCAQARSHEATKWKMFGLHAHAMSTSAGCAAPSVRSTSLAPPYRSASCATRASRWATVGTTHTNVRSACDHSRSYEPRTAIAFIGVALILQGFCANASRNNRGSAGDDFCTRRRLQLIQVLK